jgi:hypothetical protein
MRYAFFFSVDGRIEDGHIQFFLKVPLLRSPIPTGDDA